MNYNLHNYLAVPQMDVTTISREIPTEKHAALSDLSSVFSHQLQPGMSKTVPHKHTENRIMYYKTI